MDDKLLPIATVLAALPAQMRLALARHLVSSHYAIVPRRSDPPIEEAFKVTASRFHVGLKAELKFNARAIGACWQAMVAKAETRRDCEVDGLDEEPAAAEAAMRR